MATTDPVCLAGVPVVPRLFCRLQRERERRLHLWTYLVPSANKCVTAFVRPPESLTSLKASIIFSFSYLRLSVHIPLTIPPKFFISLESRVSLHRIGPPPPLFFFFFRVTHTHSQKTTTISGTTTTAGSRPLSLLHTNRTRNVELVPHTLDDSEGCPSCGSLMAKHGRGSGSGASPAARASGSESKTPAAAQPAKRRRGAPQTFSSKLYKILQDAQLKESSPVGWCLEGERKPSVLQRGRACLLFARRACVASLCIPPPSLVFVFFFWQKLCDRVCCVLPVLSLCAVTFCRQVPPPPPALHELSAATAARPSPLSSMIRACLFWRLGRVQLLLALLSPLSLKCPCVCCDFKQQSKTGFVLCFWTLVSETLLEKHKIHARAYAHVEGCPSCCLRAPGSPLPLWGVLRACLGRPCACV